MNENYIRKLIKLVEESEIESLEISKWGQKIRITGKGAYTGNGQATAPAIIQQVAPVAAAPAPTSTDPKTAEPAELDKSNLVPITAPMVGTFYSAPAPDADVYVSLNSKVRAGQVVCIVEAMKLMNEIESEVSGRVVEILAQNGKPVEFGQELFLIAPE